MKNLTALLLGLAMLLPACDMKPPPPGKGALAAVAGCDPKRIEFYAARYNAQLVFDACGINNFRNFRWSPDGNRLFFQTPAGPFVLNAKTRAIDVLPISSPTDTPIWLTKDFVAFGHAPSAADKNHRIDFYNVNTRVWSNHEIKKLKNPRLLQNSPGSGFFYFVADSAAAKGRVYSFSVEDGVVKPAFKWIKGGLTSLAYHPKQDLVAYSIQGGDEVILARARDGKVIKTFASATRATISTDAKWVLVEETSTRRLAASKDARPPFAPVRPPRLLYLWDRKAQRRVEMKGVLGSQAEWYPGHNYFSVILQGFGDTMYNPNILLVDVDNMLLNMKLRNTQN